MDPYSNSVISIILLGICLLLLIMLSAVFSASETAYTSITKFRFDTHYKKKHKGILYRINTKLLDQYSMTLSTILLSNTLANVASSTISTLFFTEILRFANVPNSISIATGVATGVITLMVLIFGEFLPKSIARKYPIKCIQLFGIFIYCLYWLLWPVNWLLNKIVKQDKTKSATEQELDTLIDIVKQEGTIESHEASLVSNALKFDETRIHSVMNKIENLVTIKYTMTQEQIANIFKQSTYSRLPVQRNGKYVGILNLKTFFINMDHTKKRIRLDKLMDPIIFVSQYDTLDKVLQEMKISQTHFALIKKNHNSSVILGLVTMENILENLVGKIYDENDEIRSVTRINDFTWKVKATTSANRFISHYLKLNLHA